MSLGLLLPTKEGLLLMADKRSTLITEAESGAPHFKYWDTGKKLLPINDHCVIDAFHKSTERNSYGCGYDSVRLGREALTGLFLDNDSVNVVSRTLTKIIELEYSEFIQFLPLNHRFDNNITGISSVLNVANYSKQNDRFEYVLFRTQPLPGDSAAVKVTTYYYHQRQLHRSFLSTFGADPISPKLRQGLPPYEKVSKEEWCQKFLAHPQQASETSVKEGFLAACKMFDIVQQFNASGSKDGPVWVSRELDALLITKTGINWLCKNLNVDNAEDAAKAL